MSRKVLFHIVPLPSAILRPDSPCADTFPEGKGKVEEFISGTSFNKEICENEVELK